MKAFYSCFMESKVSFSSWDICYSFEIYIYYLPFLLLNSVLTWYFSKKKVDFIKNKWSHVIGVGGRKDRRNLFNIVLIYEILKMQNIMQILERTN